MAGYNTIRAFAPATVANVACGFDVFGLALEQPGDEVELTLNHTGRVIIRAITGDNGCLPAEASRNTAGIALLAMLQSVASGLGAELVLHKKLPLGSGMGSSAASAVAALVAANASLGNPLSPRELIPFALVAEQEACGAAHADNVAPALLGGFVLIRDAQHGDMINIPVPPDLRCVVVHPHISINTRQARQALRHYIRLSDATRQWANTAALVAAMYEQNYELLSRALCDVVAEPVRSLFVPGFDRVKQAALYAGALGCSLSGSGPSMFALCRSEENGYQVCRAMQQAFHDAGLPSDGFVSAVNTTGARVVNQEKTP